MFLMTSKVLNVEYYLLDNQKLLLRYRFLTEMIITATIFDHSKKIIYLRHCA